MDRPRDEFRPPVLIGPGLEPEPETECEPERDARLEGRRLLVRLVIAFVLIAGVAFLCFGVLPRAGVHLPPWVPLMAFGAIAVAALLNASSEGQLPTRSSDQDGCDGRAVGCCPGPRPPRFLSEPRRDR